MSHPPDAETVRRYAIRARRMNGNVYIRKDDLLKWLDDEATTWREKGYTEAADHTASLAADLRKIRA